VLANTNAAARLHCPSSSSNIRGIGIKDTNSRLERRLAVGKMNCIILKTSKISSSKRQLKYSG